MEINSPSNFAETNAAEFNECPNKVLLDTFSFLKMKCLLALKNP